MIVLTGYNCFDKTSKKTATVYRVQWRFGIAVFMVKPDECKDYAFVCNKKGGLQKRGAFFRMKICRFNWYRRSPRKRKLNSKRRTNMFLTVDTY